MFLTKTRIKRIWSTVALIVVMAFAPATVAHAACANGQDSCSNQWGVSGATFNSGGISDSCNPGNTMCVQGAAGDLAAGLIGQSYEDAVQADSPVGFWRLGESSGTTAADSSGHSRNGTYEGGYKLQKPGLATNKDTAARLDGGSGGDVKIPSSSVYNINNTGHLAVEFWYQGTAVGGSDPLNPSGMVSNNSSSSAKQWVVGMDNSGHVDATFVTADTNAYLPLISNGVINDGQRHYIVVDYNRSASTVEIYIDGILDNSTFYAGGFNTWAASNVYIGKDGRTGAGITGTYDDVAIYGSNLSATQVAKHYYTAFSSYQAQVGSVETSWPYLEMSVGTTAVDAGVLKDDETHVGTATFSVKSYLAQGYQVTTNSPGPKNGSYVMQLLNPASGGSAGTEGFGMNLVANSCPSNSSFSGTGNCTGSLGADPAQQPDETFGFGHAAANYDTPGQYYYNDGDIIAQSDSSSGFTDYTLSYIFNISGVTPGGTYTMNQSLVTTSTF